MFTPQTTIEDIMEDYIDSFIERVLERYPDIDPLVLLSLWTGDVETPVKPKKETPVKPKKETPVKPNEPIVKSVSKPIIRNTCPYVFSKGDKQGTVCGSRAIGGTHCTKHKKYEKEGQKHKKISPNITKPAVSFSDKSLYGKLILRKNHDIGKLWDLETKMVFESAQIKEVIGKCVNNEIKPLSEEDRQICKDHRFKIKSDDVSDQSVKKITEVINKTTNQSKKNMRTVAKTLITEDTDYQDVEKIINEMFDEDKDENIYGDDTDIDEFEMDNEPDIDDELED